MVPRETLFWEGFMTERQFRGEVPAIAAAIAKTRTREYLYGRYVQAQLKADADDNFRDTADRAWDEYADECARLGQCTSPGCFENSPHRAYCPRHDETLPDYGD